MRKDNRISFVIRQAYTLKAKLGRAYLSPSSRLSSVAKRLVSISSKRGSPPIFRPADTNDGVVCKDICLLCGRGTTGETIWADLGSKGVLIMIWQAEEGHKDSNKQKWYRSCGLVTRYNSFPGFTYCASTLWCSIVPIRALSHSLIYLRYFLIVRFVYCIRAREKTCPGRQKPGETAARGLSEPILSRKI